MNVVHFKRIINVDLIQNKHADTNILVEAKQSWTEQEASILSE